MCGILGLLLADTRQHCRQQLFDGLTVLQHRGQDAAGIVTASTDNNSTRLNQVKGLGMVRDVFNLDEMLMLEGNSGIGHCRYPTAGTSSKEESQPMYNNYPCGLALAHNGNLTNKDELQEHVRGLHRHLNTQSDSEALLNVFAEELRLQLDERGGNRSARLEPDCIFNAVKQTMGYCRGGYAVVMLVHDVGVLAFRDPHGIRPLVMGRRCSTTMEGGIDYAFSSESVATDTLGFELVRDVRPGECILVVPMKRDHPREDEGLITRQLIGDGKISVPCLFEYVYFSRPDTVMNGVSVHASRLAMGEKLAKKVQNMYPDTTIDVVIPVPDTSRTCALSCASALNIPYREGFVKNRYIGRTFIMPEQEIRKRNVRLKLNTVKSEFQGKNVLLVDDSIVRGTTSRELIVMAREAGAKNVFFCSASPEIRHPNIYGIDLPTSTELIAHGKTPEDIAAELGCNWVVFQDIEDLEDCIRGLNPELETFENSTFTGKYVTNDVDEKYFLNLAGERNNSTKVLNGACSVANDPSPSHRK
mmetsp:Transcript_19845/g.32615  ORF Transcript_19845/g.32615 Transcript_19845/m.32615 type:complete len:530 (-) Transcript_19845:49-1638(-)